MRINRYIATCIIACFAILVGTSAAQTNVTSVPDGQKAKVLGYINQRSEERLLMTTLDGAKYVVQLSPSTSVKSNTKGVFRGGGKYELSHLLRGLRVQVE